MGMITLPKELISKESILKLLKQYPTVLVNADSSSWLLSSEEDLPSEQWEEIRKELIEIEETVLFENQVSTIRTLLYQKAFPNG